MEYGAIDLHKQNSLIRIVDATGTVVLDRTITTTREGFTRVFAGRAPLRVLVESGTESEWVAQTVEASGHAVIVADPNYALMYGRGRERSRRTAAMWRRWRRRVGWGCIAGRIGCRPSSGRGGGRCGCAGKSCACGRN